MLIVVSCQQCEFEIGINPAYVGARGDVRQDWQCPYCQHKYHRGDRMKVSGARGGVRIEDSDVEIHGDVTGGDKYVFKG